MSAINDELRVKEEMISRLRREAKDGAAAAYHQMQRARAAEAELERLTEAPEIIARPETREWQMQRAAEIALAYRAD